MVFDRNQFFAIAWRLAILSLPWQTRWMYTTTLAGWPWEQGTIALYLSWFPLLATTILGWSLAKRSINTRSFKILLACGIALVCASLGALIFSDPHTRYVRGTVMLQWWIQCSILFSFGVVLWRSGLVASTFMNWCILSILPHAGLGIVQYIYQISPAFKWLGLAQHLPSQLGTSVIEHDGLRVLRAYGGFPHPNIFGGWLVFAIVLIVKKIILHVEKKQNSQYISALVLCSSALVLTYSRSAWIAVLMVLFFFFFSFLREPSTFKKAVHSLGPVFAFTGITIFAIIFSQADHVFTRFDSSARLETKSLSTRTQSILNGFEIFFKKPLFGSGVHASLLDISALSTQTVATEPLELPHMAYLVVLIEYGILGVLAIILLCVYFLPRSIWHIPLILIGTVSLFDHYPVSLWAGQSLVMLCVLLAFLPYTQKQEEYSTE